MFNRSFFRGVVFCAVLVIAIVIIFGVRLLAEDTGVVHEAHETNWDKVYITLHTLVKAVNDPNSFHINSISSMVPEADRERVSTILKAPALKQNSVKSLNGIPINSKVTFRIRKITKEKDGYKAKVTVYCDVNQYLFEKDIDVQYYRQGQLLKIGNIKDVLSAVVTLKNKSVEKLRLDKNLKPCSSAKKSLGVTDYQSDNLLTPYNIYDPYQRMDVPTSQSLLDGRIIFSRPYGVSAFYYDDAGGPTGNHKYLFCTDANWDRIIALEEGDVDEDNWITSFGSNGTGVNNFRNPTGIDHYIWTWVVADAYNNRALVYSLGSAEPTDSLIYQYTIEDSFDVAIDVAVSTIPSGIDPNHDYTEIAVLDQGHNRVKIYDYWGEFKSEVFSTGSGENQLNHPTAICFDRYSGYPCDAIYVTDDGNKRVISRTLGYNPIFRTTESIKVNGSYFQFPSDAYLTSVDVDNYGYVYVVDSHNSKIYMFSPGLEDLIAIYGGKGTGDKQLLYPLKFTIDKGVRYNDTTMFTPIMLGDAFVTEFFGDQTGIRRYVLGDDILWNDIYYVPKWDTGGYDYMRCKWYQTTTTESWREVYNGYGMKLDSEYEPLNLPGYQIYTYQFNDTDQDDLYSVKIHTKSKYDSSIDTTFTVYILISRSVDTTCTPKFVKCTSMPADPKNVTCGYYVTYLDGGDQRCIVAGDNRWLKAQVKLEYSDSIKCMNGHDSLYYFWIGGLGYHYTLDTMSYCSDDWSLCRNLLTPVNYVFFKVPSTYGWSGDQLLTTVYVTTMPDTPFVHHYQFDDTLDINWPLYSNYCLTPCTTCVNPPACPMLYSWDGEQYRFENNILPQSEDPDINAKEYTDYYPLYNVYQNDSNYYRFFISEDEHEITNFDYFELYTADIPNRYQPAIIDNEQGLGALTGTAIAPVSAVTNDNEDILNKLQNSDELDFKSDIPGYIDLEYRFEDIGILKKPTGSQPAGGIAPPPPDKGALKAVVHNNQSRQVNIYTLYAQNATGGYEEVEKIYPRRQDNQQICNLSSYINDKGILKIRLAWSNSIDIDYLPYLQYHKINTTLNKAKLIKAVHSSFGEVGATLKSATDNHITLQPGQQLKLTFQTTPQADTIQRVLLFKAVGKYKSLNDQNADANEILPDKFTFSQNYPNPFNPSTTFKFELPQTVKVKLEIYNILGERVITLVDGTYEAGAHRAYWDGKDGTGEKVSSGIYFAKFQAGDYQANKKMVVLK